MCSFTVEKFKVATCGLLEKRAYHNVSVMNLLALSSKFTLHCLLCHNGQDSVSISLYSEHNVKFLSVEGAGGTSQGEKRLLQVPLCCVLLLAPAAWSISDVYVWGIQWCPDHGVLQWSRSLSLGSVTTILWLSWPHTHSCSPIALSALPPASLACILKGCFLLAWQLWTSYSLVSPVKLQPYSSNDLWPSAWGRVSSYTRSFLRYLPPPPTPKPNPRACFRVSLHLCRYSSIIV